MLNIPKTNEMIREAQLSIGRDASNKDIKLYCSSKYGVQPLSQAIYSCLGSEYSRKAERVTVRELSDCKRFIRKTFDGDMERAYLALELVEDFR